MVPVVHFSILVDFIPKFGYPLQLFYEPKISPKQLCTLFTLYPKLKQIFIRYFLIYIAAHSIAVKSRIYIEYNQNHTKIIYFIIFKFYDQPPDLIKKVSIFINR